MKHMTNKQAIYEAVRSMEGRPFTAYDIREKCTRDIALQSITCIVKGIPGVQKVEDGANKGGSIWQVPI